MRVSVRPSAEETPAFSTGRYRIEHPLGKGGAAHVFCATDTSSGRRLALKRLHSNAGEKSRAQFELEYQTLAGLKHPRIVEAFEYGVDAQSPFYTMELLEGEDLKQLAPIPWREACAHLRDAAQALGLLHARRVLHRDVSPRNLWRTPDGRVKLIDFGTLVGFGVSDQVVGTPPHIAPEVLRRSALDQRSDLYSLGGVAYYLITGLHAYPARDVRDLPAMWHAGFKPASQRVAELGRSDLPAVPPELDHLLAALLDAEVLARPPSAEALIDRLDVSFGSARPSCEEPAHARLSNSSFVGRTRELRALRGQLRLADGGQGQSCLVESEPGMGRSRLLREFVLEAAVLPSAVLHVDAALSPGLNGVAEALALKLLTTLPEIARASVGPYADILAHLSPRMADRLAVAPRAVDGGALELRAQQKVALSEWLLAVAARHTLVVVVDGLEAIDDASLAFLHALALGRAQRRLLLVCALEREHGRKITSSATVIAKQSQRLVLGPLAESEVGALLGSVFGETMHLGRLAGRLQRAARGNPRNLFALSEQLVRQEVVRLVGGAWVIPRDLPEASLTWTHEQGVASRIAQLGRVARELGSVLSVHDGPLPIALARSLAGSLSPQSFLHLSTLLDGDIMVRDGDLLHFCGEPFRAELLAHLAPATKRRVQCQIGAFLLEGSASDALMRLRAGTYLLEGGDPRGPAIVARTALHLVATEPEKIGSALPTLETALRCFKAAGRSDDELVPLLVPLTMGGYYKDLSYVHAYGDATIALLDRMLALPVARRLTPLLGGRRALKAANIIADARLRLRGRRPTVPSTQEAAGLMLRAVATLVGASAQVVDAPGAKRYAEVLRPYAALGAAHPAALYYELCASMADALSDAAARAQARILRFQATLSEPVVTAQLPAVMRQRLVAAVLHTLGVRYAMQESDRALRTAEQLERLPSLVNKVQAEQVRASYYAHRGDHERLELANERLEHYAIQQGTLASTETWTLSTMIGYCVRTHDAIRLKRISQALQKLARDIPQLSPLAQRAWALYLLVHCKYEEAIPALEASLVEEVRSRISWGRNKGMLAHAYNRLGKHRRAREICVEAVSLLEPGDRDFPSLSVTQQAELLVAEAGLGRATEARAGLAELIAFYAPRSGPLTMGQLHQTGLEIAMLANDHVAMSAHLAEVERWYLSTGVASLVSHCKWLRQRVERATGEPGAPRSNSTPFPSDDDDGISEPWMHVERLLAGGSMTADERMLKGLSLMVELTGSAGGFILWLDEHGAPQRTASLGEEPDALIMRWVEQRIARELEDEQTQLDADDDAEERGSEVLIHAGIHYRATSMTVAGHKPHGVVGVVVLAACDRPPRGCPPEIVSAIGYYLQRALQA